VKVVILIVRRRGFGLCVYERRGVCKEQEKGEREVE
jgi:hypothetical protein